MSHEARIPKSMDTKPTQENPDSASLRSGDLFGVWVDIETAPKDGTRILCSYRGNRPFIARWRNDFSVFMDDWDSWRDATHWTPLPPSPNTADEQRRGNDIV